MKKVLFIASLPNKKKMYDGERNKSKEVLWCLKQLNCKIDVIDLTKIQILQILKLYFLLKIKRYDVLFVSKCIVGGSLALKLFNKWQPKNKKTNKWFYIIGNGDIGFEDKKIYYDEINKCDYLIVESPIVEQTLKQKVESPKYLLFPCVKKIYDLSQREKIYTNDTVLKAIYFSRIHEQKGVLDAINAVIAVNEKMKKTCFTLDIAGGVNRKETCTTETEKKVIEYCEKYPYINYLKLSLRATDKNSYERISEYDLHMFPSHFAQECAPGSVIDMFIAGVPTISSRFESSKYIMSEQNSFFFEMNNLEQLIEQLTFIYNNKRVLNQKRNKLFLEKNKYSRESFVDFLRKNNII